MFDYIEKDMKLDDRETLNFVLGCFFILLCVINIMIFVSPFKPLITVSLSLTFLEGYMLYLNNKIGLEQQRSEKREENEKLKSKIEESNRFI